MRLVIFALCLAPLPALAQPVAAPAQAAGNAGAAAVMLPDVDVIGTSPLIGSGIDRNKLPAATNVLTSGDIARQGTPDLVNALNEQVGPVTLDSASGNPFQPTLFYRGFEASPLQGTPEGIAVYVNGERFNQPFGDTVNWDLIPNIAIDRLDLEGANPVFGLNALGGSLNVQLKNGFTYHGGEADLSGGSFGQILGEFQYGKQSGNTSIYVAGSELHQDGWRDLQSSDVQNFYGDIGWRGRAAEVHLNITLANSVLNGPGTSPVELLDVDPAAQFTAPNLIANKYLNVNLSGTGEITDTTSVQGVVYYDYFQQRVVNGNAPNDLPCNDGTGLLCSGGPGVLSTTRGGLPIPALLGASPYAYSALDDQTTNTNGYGASVQVTNTDDILGRQNHFVAGLSFDGAQTEFGATSYVGGITPDSRVFVGPGVTIDEPGSNAPVRVAISDESYGAFISDTFSPTKALSITVSGRFNSAQISLNDQGGGDLSGNHAYNRFNPAVGATYTVAPWLTAYAGYSEANRAPTPAELSCASPQDSCSLANFFVGDPDLKQVVAHTVEAGMRGTLLSRAARRLTYDVSLYHTDLDDDIIFVNSVTLDRAYFTNVGQTRRQGVDAGLQYRDDRWLAYIQYSYIDATFQSAFVEDAGSNPVADANGNINVRPGNRLPGVPANQVKVGLFYKVTPKWTVGATGIGESGQYLFGDEGNTNAKLPGFFTLNLSTSYQVTPAIQVFGLAENVNNARYYNYGVFAPTTAVFLAQAPNATNPRAYSPAAPIGGFGGIRVKF